MNKYNPAVINQPTERPGPSAQTRVVLYTIAGVLVALAGGFFIGHGFDIRAIPGAVILGALGYAIGSYRAPIN